MKTAQQRLSQLIGWTTGMLNNLKGPRLPDYSDMVEVVKQAGGLLYYGKFKVDTLRLVQVAPTTGYAPYNPLNATVGDNVAYALSQYEITLSGLPSEFNTSKNYFARGWLSASDGFGGDLPIITVRATPISIIIESYTALGTPGALPVNDVVIDVELYAY